MSSQYTGKILGLVGALFLAHSAYSTYERMVHITFLHPSLHLNSFYPCFFSVDLAYIKAVDEVNNTLPVEVKTTPFIQFTLKFDIH